MPWGHLRYVVAMTDIASELIERVIVREGGYVNHANDAGGPTKYGITIGTLQDWRRRPVSVEDVQNLTVDEAREIYRVKYFTATGFDRVKDPQVQEFLFDFAVNSGERAAIRALQRSIGTPDDGAFGPKSAAAMAAITNYGMLFYKLKAERYELLLRYVGSDPRQAVFAQGWSNRLDQFEEKVT